MEIIQASCTSNFRPYIHPPARRQSSRYHTGIHVLSWPSPCSISPVQSKIPTYSKPISTTRAILDSSTSDSVATKTVEHNPSLAIKKKAFEVSTDLKGTSIFLVGINNSYKSNLGRMLADEFRYYYFDSDSLVEEAAGGKEAAISLLEEDEEGYLASETEVLKQLSSMGRLIVCAGNGAVNDATNLALLRHGISIWIDVPLDLVARDVLEDRVQLSAYDMHVCGSSSEVPAQLATLYSSARSGYSTADATISFLKVASQLGYDELDAVTTEDLCIEVLKEIEKLVRVKKMMEDAARPF
ncbi:Probable inactive shikimate kinase like 1-chloroplastic [Striga hermonthica]|uniref:Probable inactive shikimate kinase like 1-chloroplastic n=1 Tax=Striga hermonthica TaxID=68872 RepID=A0A9N7MQZ6_STRHE|nr:Probable inactive shikimate kinase like 1-chloroplastic [Striga hermonthica]